MQKEIMIKVCGMRNEANILAVAALRPDYLGFIEYAPSPRFVGPSFRPPELPVPVTKVGVFVNESFENIQRRVALAGYDGVQLHGDESPDFAARLHELGLRVIKVFRVDDEFNFEETRPYKGKVDQVLFDARGRHPGGNGIRFNPTLLQRYDQDVPFFLSGGLQPETLRADIDGLKTLNLYGVDLNSGVEEAPGLKDVSRVRATMEQVRGK